MLRGGRVLPRRESSSSVHGHNAVTYPAMHYPSTVLLRHATRLRTLLQRSPTIISVFGQAKPISGGSCNRSLRLRIYWDTSSWVNNYSCSHHPRLIIFNNCKNTLFAEMWDKKAGCCINSVFIGCNLCRWINSTVDNFKCSPIKHCVLNAWNVCHTLTLRFPAHIFLFYTSACMIWLFYMKQCNAQILRSLILINA